MKLTQSEKAEALGNIVSFCVTRGLPIPENIEAKHNIVKANTSLWPFEADVPQVQPYDSDKQKAAQTEWLQAWIKDIASKLVDLGRGYKVSKEWDDYLTIHIDCPTENWRISYGVQREVVCEKKIVGTKHVEAIVLKAHDVEVVEWVCNDKSLLGDD